MKIGLLIQGPIISQGRNFVSSASVKFDSNSNICELYQKAVFHNCEAVLLTWKDEDVSKLEIPKKDIFQFCASKSELSKHLMNNRKSTKYKQFFLVRKGLQVLKERNCDVVIKVRTDQLFDLATLIDHIKKCSLNEDHRIMTLFADSRIIDSWVDFTFAGQVEELSKIFEKYVSQKELFSSVHRDFFYHLLREDYGFLENLISKVFLPYSGKNFSQRQLGIIRKNWEHHFLLMPIEILKGFSWRGSSFDSSNLDKNFFGHDSFPNFLKNLDYLNSQAPKFSMNFFSLDALTIFFPGSVADNCRRLLTGLFKRLRISRR